MKSIPAPPDAPPPAPSAVAAGRWIAIHNPTAGLRRRHHLDRVLARLAQLGIAVERRETTGRGDAEAMAHRAAREPGVSCILLAGGDGTINEALNGLDGRAPALAVVPLGTANVLAAELGLPRTAAATAALLAAGPARAIHLGVVAGRRFAMMAGVGFDAHVVDRVRPAVKRRLGKGAYALEILRGLIAFSPRRYRVQIDDSGPVVATSAIVCNGRFYGGRYVLAPAASLALPALEVVLFRGSGRWNAIRYLAATALGRVHRLPDVTIRTARRVRVEAEDGAREPVQADGDIVARLPVRIAVAPDTMTVVAPPPGAPAG